MAQLVELERQEIYDEDVNFMLAIDSFFQDIFNEPFKIEGYRQSFQKK